MSTAWHKLSHRRRIGFDFGEARPGIDEFQRMPSEREQRIMFFLNLAPVVCQTQDRFTTGVHLSEDDALQAVMGKDTLVVSTTRAFLHYRPSQMPAASDHALGNANRVRPTC